jgi:hypothetical protein
MTRRVPVAICLSLALGFTGKVAADTLHVTADTMVSEAAPNSAFGDQPLVTVRNSGQEIHGYARFDLDALGAVAPGTAVRRATLRAWIGPTAVDGDVAVRPISGTWDEHTVTWNSAPSLGAVVDQATIRRDNVLRYVTFDVTAIVQDWVDGTLANDGLALVPDGRIDIGLDSKESTGTSHPMELEVVFEDANSGGDITAVQTPAGSGLQGGVVDGDATLGLTTGCGAGQLLKWSGSDWTCSTDLVGTGPAAGWGLSGNAGTTAGASFIGTTDSQALELKVNGERALRVEPHHISPNLIGGSSTNYAFPPAYGAFVGGGGTFTYPNRVYGHFGTVPGGQNNICNGNFAVIGGGDGNFTLEQYATIAGGIGNQARLAATIGGGAGNGAAQYATVPGGVGNAAGGHYSFAAGHRAVVRDEHRTGTLWGDRGTFVWADFSTPNSDFVSSGSNQFLVRATGGVGINTNTPAAGSALTVNGNTTLTGNASTNGAIGFGNTTRQMLNLYATAYGIGVQSYSFYSRSDSEFAWFRGGVHDNGTGNPGAGGTRQMRLDGNGNLFVRGTVNGGGADFAEMLPAQGGVEPGDVLAIAPDGRLVLSTEPYQKTVAGVHSTKPALLGGAHDGADLTGKVPLAVTGIVPVKVTDENGPIVPGDLLTSSSAPGRAMKAGMIRVGGVEFFPSGVLIGKALQPLESGEGVIEALVVLQ